LTKQLFRGRNTIKKLKITNSIAVLSALLALSLNFASTTAAATEFTQRLDLQGRVDDRSSSNLRY